MATKRTMTLQLADAEMDALEALAAHRDISKTAVIRQALRMYQTISYRLERGEKMYFENEVTKDKSELVLL